LPAAELSPLSPLEIQKLPFRKRPICGLAAQGSEYVKAALHTPPPCPSGIRNSWLMAIYQSDAIFDCTHFHHHVDRSIVLELERQRNLETGQEGSV
jgi:hypothetical protein